MPIDDYDSDDTFTKPGSIPFKWEIRPGVPKIQAKQPPQSPPPPLQPYFHKPLKLKPPPSPSPSLFPRPPEPQTRTRSFRSASASRTRSERWRFEQPNNILARRSETVESAGCFMSPLLKRKQSSKRGSGTRTVPALVSESEPDFTLDLETLARWSLSSRKSLLSPFRDSPTSTSTSTSSNSSYKSSPRPVSDAEWAGFGLF